MENAWKLLYLFQSTCEEKNQTTILIEHFANKYDKELLYLLQYFSFEEGTGTVYYDKINIPIENICQWIRQRFSPFFTICFFNRGKCIYMKPSSLRYGSDQLEFWQSIHIFFLQGRHFVVLMDFSQTMQTYKWIKSKMWFIICIVLWNSLPPRPVTWF